MQKLSKGFYLGSIIGSWVVAGIFLIIGIILFVGAGVTVGDMKNINWGLIGGGVIAILIAIIVGIFGTVIVCILLFRSWQAIQDGQPRTTPGKAVGFLFIPFFNLYWFFVAYWGFAQDYNKHLNLKGLSLPKLSEGLFLSYPILTICSGIPYIGSLAGLAEFPIAILIYNYMIDAVNNLYNASGQTTVVVAPTA